MGRNAGKYYISPVSSDDEMGSYSVSEYGEEAAGKGGGGAGTNNFDRAVQSSLEEIRDVGDDVQEEYGLSDGQMESLNQAQIGDNVSAEDAAALKDEMANAMASGDLSEAQAERVVVTNNPDGSDREGSVSLRVNRNNTPYAGDPQVVNVGQEGMGEGQARRLVNQEVMPANGIVDVDNEAAEEARLAAANADANDYEVFEQTDVAALQAEVGNENMAQGQVVDQMRAANQDLATLHDEETFVAGARNNRADGVASTADLRKTVVDEVEAEADNTGTNVWNKTGDTYKSVIDARGEDQIGESTKQQVDIMHAASQDLDIVEDSPWEDDGAVFDESNLTQESVEEWAGNKYGNAGNGAGTSRNLVEEVRDWAADTLPEN